MSAYTGAVTNGGNREGGRGVDVIALELAVAAEDRSAEELASPTWYTRGKM